MFLQMNIQTALCCKSGLATWKDIVNDTVIMVIFNDGKSQQDAMNSRLAVRLQ